MSVKIIGTSSAERVERTRTLLRRQISVAEEDNWKQSEILNGDRLTFFCDGYIYPFPKSHGNVR